MYCLAKGVPYGGAWDKFAQVQNFLGKFVGENGIWIPEVVLGRAGIAWGGSLDRI